MLGHDRRHHLTGLCWGPEGGPVVEIQADEAVVGPGGDSLQEGIQVVIPLVSTVYGQSKRNPGGVEKPRIFQRLLPVHHARTKPRCRRVHPLVDPDVLARCAADLVDKAANGFGPGCPHDVVRVHPLLAGQVADSPAIGVVGHTGDEGGRDAQAAEADGQSVLAACHREVYQPRSLGALVVRWSVANHNLAKGDEHSTASIKSTEIIARDVKLECRVHGCFLSCAPTGKIRD